MPSAPTVPATLSSHLRRLGLTRLATDLNDLLARAATERWTPLALLEAAATSELEDRARRSLERRFTCARLGRFKPIADLEWDWPKTIDRPLVERVLRHDFLTEAENVVLVGAHEPRQDADRQEPRAPGDPVAVGTPVARCPPHRSQRAALPHWALTSGSTVEALFRPGMGDVGRGKPPSDQPTQPLPEQPPVLAAAP